MERHKHIDFNFYDCQLETELDSENEDYIKRKCRERINMAGKFLLLIGQDTRSKHKYVRWEAEVAIEKGCTIIGVNLDKSRFLNSSLTPPIIQNIGAIFVPFSSKIIAEALQNYEMKASENRIYTDAFYTKLGYSFSGNTAYIQKPRNPFQF